MKAKFPVCPEAQTHSQQQIAGLLYPQDLIPSLDLRTGHYQSCPHIIGNRAQRFASAKAASMCTGLAMFYYYMQVVRRDRALALRGQYSDYLWARSGLELTRLFEGYGGNFTIEGLQHLRPWLAASEAGAPAPVVFAVNHMSTLETQTLCGYISPYMPTTFIVKAALAQGYFAPLICSRPYIALKRKNPLADLEVVLREGTEILHGEAEQHSESTPKGRSIIVFPQGTREEGQFSRSRFNSIAVRLAARAGVYVVPVALSTSFWSQSPNKAIQYLPLLRPEQPVRFAFGAPIASACVKKAQTQVLNFICDQMRQWGVSVLE